MRWLLLGYNWRRRELEADGMETMFEIDSAFPRFQEQKSACGCCNVTPRLFYGQVHNSLIGRSESMEKNDVEAIPQSGVGRLRPES